MNQANKKTIENLFSTASQQITVPSYSEFSRLMNRPIKSSVTSFIMKRKSYGWMIRGFVMVSIAAFIIMPVIYSKQGASSLETQIITGEASGEVSLLDQEDAFIGKSVDNLFDQLLSITT